MKTFSDFIIVGGGDSTLSVWSGVTAKRGDTPTFVQTSAVLNTGGGVVAITISNDGSEVIVQRKSELHRLSASHNKHSSIHCRLLLEQTMVK